MSESPKDPVAQAAMRLEAAVERLAQVIAARPLRAPEAGGGVSRAHLAALAERLDETIAQLRDALGEEEEDGELAAGEEEH